MDKLNCVVVVVVVSTIDVPKLPNLINYTNLAKCGALRSGLLSLCLATLQAG